MTLLFYCGQITQLYVIKYKKTIEFITKKDILKI